MVTKLAESWRIVFSTQSSTALLNFHYCNPEAPENQQFPELNSWALLFSYSWASQTSLCFFPSPSAFQAPGKHSWEAEGIFFAPCSLPPLGSSIVTPPHHHPPLTASSSCHKCSPAFPSPNRAKGQVH